MEIFWVLERYKLIFHSMYKECWASNFFDPFNILESILDQIFEHLACLVLSDSSDAFKAAH